MIRPPAGEVPDAPGAYMFKDAHGRVIYVGKALSIRKRTSHYFARELGERTRAMVESADSLEWIVTDSEVAALMLEFSLIKTHRPRFNIRLVDDKSYPYLAITRSDEWPRARVMRGAKRKGVEYFGPFAHAYAIRSTLDLLLRTFPIRTCTDALFKRQRAQGRPCLLFHIEKCTGPCVGEVTHEVYDELVDGLAGFLRGNTDQITGEIRQRMLDVSGRQEYEMAARYRDRLRDVERASERQEVVTDRRENLDVIATYGDDLETSVQVLYVRSGRVVGRLGSIIDRVEDVSEGGLVANLLRELYGDEQPPRELFVATMPEDAEVWEAWLGERRGGRVSLRVPQRGSKRRLMETATTNAREAFARHRLRRQSDHNARAKALRSLQETLDLPEAPLRIEAFDVSTLQGTNTVASMVVLEDGLPKRSEYRRFRIKTVEGQDDFAAMEETVRRRFTAYLREQRKTPAEQGKFSYPPSLVLVDGGPGQLGRASKVLAELDLQIPVAGLAKRMEEVYLPGQPEPIRIPRDEEALYLLQTVRDEAHRFAITYHRNLRSKRMIDSSLDTVEGIGPTRKKALLKRFGSLKQIRAASRDELKEVLPEAVAAELYSSLRS
ncbi:MAG: excinuclease ABC subunit UvrC [Acidimicrobiia bacterium]|nr:excinuclease ABC subunit UvrC [Acidimicrobiia bacterium]MDQ3501112.1 excinuclease ABC subunit UvrC [Actinomycetota bacterium]